MVVAFDEEWIVELQLTRKITEDTPESWDFTRMLSADVTVLKAQKVVPARPDGTPPRSTELCIMTLEKMHGWDAEQFNFLLNLILDRNGVIV